MNNLFKILSTCLIFLVFSAGGWSQSETEEKIIDYDYPSSMSEYLIHPDFELMVSSKDVSHTGIITEYRSTLTKDQFETLLNITKNENRILEDQLISRMDTVIWFNSFLMEETITILSNDLTKEEFDLIFNQ